MLSHFSSILSRLNGPRRNALVRFTVVVVAVCFLLLGLTHRRVPQNSPPVDVRSLIASLPHAEGFAFSENGSGPLEPLGTETDMIVFDSRQVIDSQTGHPLTGADWDVVFNLAVLRLPDGSKWDYVGVARGPTRSRRFITVNSFAGREQVLVLLGLNMTAGGTLLPVTTGKTIFIPMAPTEACLPTGYWAATYGAEDPRLMYTDAGTPALVFGRLSDRSDKCRTLSIVPDLRFHSKELADAMAPSVGMFDGVLGAGDGVERELAAGENQTLIEKNWSPFYPGALPDKSAVFPHIHYSLSPDTSLAPTAIGNRLINYTEIPRNEHYADCVHLAHPELPGWRLHQATPLYRLTLCKRSDVCHPSIHNTVYLTLAHIELRPRYRKLFVTYNTTAPYEPVSVGPAFLMNGLNDVTEISYVLALSPLKAPQAQKSYWSSEKVQPTYPDHFFLDDSILVTLGVKDVAMASSIITVEKALARHRLCEDIVPDL